MILIDVRKIYRNILFVFLGVIVFGFLGVSYAAAKKDVAPETKAKEITDNAAVNDTVNKKTAIPDVAAETQPIAKGDNTSLLENRFLAFTENRGNPKGASDWLQRIKIGGRLDGEFNDQSRPDFGAKGQGRETRLELPVAKVNIDAKVMDFVEARLGFFYASESYRYYRSHSATKNGVIIDDGYITLAALDRTPFYARIGQEYVPFGAYIRYPITETLTQKLSELRAIAAEVGFVDKSGFSGAASVFNGLPKSSESSRIRLNDFVVALAYENRNHPLGFRLGISFLSNMNDVGEISYNLEHGYYQDRVSAFAANGDLFTGPFDIGVRYVTALQRFSTVDLAYQDNGVIKGAKPSAVTAEAGYSFKIFSRDSRAVIDYQASNEARNANGAADALILPKNRISVGYGIRILKGTVLAFELRRDHDYPKTDGGTNKYNFGSAARISVVF